MRLEEYSAGSSNGEKLSLDDLILFRSAYFVKHCPASKSEVVWHVGWRLAELECVCTAVVVLDAQMATTALYHNGRLARLFIFRYVLYHKFVEKIVDLFSSWLYEPNTDLGSH